MFLKANKKEEAVLNLKVNKNPQFLFYFWVSSEALN